MSLSPKGRASVSKDAKERFTFAEKSSLLLPVICRHALNWSNPFLFVRSPTSPREVVEVLLLFVERPFPPRPKACARERQTFTIVVYTNFRLPPHLGYLSSGALVCAFGKEKSSKDEAVTRD
uniref:Uncharacterized protein n=1 Tax=Trichuris muris TaxID=70415 RepID=A0A5S6QTG8_TRIMR